MYRKKYNNTTDLHNIKLEPKLACQDSSSSVRAVGNRNHKAGMVDIDNGLDTLS
jgi:hypothetical protein